MIVALLWGFSFLVVKDALSAITPFWFVFLRFLTASLVLAFLFPRFWRDFQSSTLLYSLVIGLFLYLGFTFQTLGLRYTSPAKSAFITGSSVLMVPLLDLFIFRIKFRRNVGIGILTAFVGLYLLTRPDHLMGWNKGDGLTCLCAVAFAFHIIFTARYAVRSPYRQLAIFQICWTFILSIPLALMIETPQLLYPVSIYISLIYLGVFCSALAFLIQTHAQQYTSASRTALIFSLEPVFAAIASAAFYGERLTLLAWFGGLLIVIGVLAGELGVIKSRNEEQLSGPNVVN
ncbi:DMT family transporter [Acidobacteria bacterium AH-259-D05]|nr:DMT family transporter [Acidobacteria bacterium AH-259-D05]